MRWIPEKTIKNLLKVLGCYAAAIFVVLLLTHLILGSRFTAQSMFGLVMVAVVSALVAGTGLWLEGKLFFLLYSIGLIVGLLYMLFVAIFNTTPGWGDLTSIIGFMFITVIGVAAGLAAEFVRYLLRSKTAKP